VTIPEYVFAQTLKSLFEPIRALLEDDTVSEILINGHDEIYIERRGTLARVEQRFASDYELLAALRNLSQYVGRAVGEAGALRLAPLPTSCWPHPSRP